MSLQKASGTLLITCRLIQTSRIKRGTDSLEAVEPKYNAKNKTDENSCLNRYVYSVIVFATRIRHPNTRIIKNKRRNTGFDTRANFSFGIGGSTS